MKKINTAPVDFKINYLKPMTPESYENAQYIKQLMEDLINDLDKLLGINLLLKKSKNLILKRVTDLTKFINKQDADGFMQEYTHMMIFTKQLASLKRLDVEMFGHFKREILKQSHQDNWYGIRAELGIAFHCLENFKGTITKRESPDFILNEKTTPVFIESTMAHTNSKKVEVLYKIGSAINKKNKKIYANNNTALCIDITNIFNRFFNDTSKQESELIDWINNYLNETKIKYGAVIMMVHMYLKAERRCQGTYSTFKLQHCSAELSNVLDNLYPKIGIEKFANPVFSNYS